MKKYRYRRTLLTFLGLLCVTASASASTSDNDQWFEAFKRTADDATLFKFLYAMPKGGDLHIHLSGSIHPEWLWRLSLEAEADGFRYYTKVRINNCRHATNEYGGNAYLLLYKTVVHYDYEKLDACEQGEFELLQDLNDEQKARWMNALRLDQAFEGRNEFFEAHWPRLGSLGNAKIMAETIYLNMQHFGAEGVRYIEGQVPIHGFRDQNGVPVSPDEVLEIYRERISRADAKATGVTLRFQVAILRFHPQAESILRHDYAFASRHPDVVALNLVGREDNDKGYPLRFLDTLRDMRRTHSGVRLSIHAGEVDEPNQHVRDTLLLGAERIGHGVNLITDPDTMLLMRRNQFLVEVNLVSNLLLEYVSDYSQHPFPEYLRTNIPVALGTDDRGMWDSTMTDEFFVAVKEFNLSWSEIRLLLNNSIKFSFAEEEVKARLLKALNDDLDKFSARVKRKGGAAYATDKSLQKVEPQYRGFICRQYEICPP
ncbi:MAG: adenosine deaminase [Pseudomonadota bacterium]